MEIITFATHNSGYYDKQDQQKKIKNPFFMFHFIIK